MKQDESRIKSIDEEDDDDDAGDEMLYNEVYQEKSKRVNTYEDASAHHYHYIS